MDLTFNIMKQFDLTVHNIQNRTTNSNQDEKSSEKNNFLF